MAKHGMFDFTNRIIGFDLLRSIAIFYVFWGHGEILVPNELKWIYSIPMIIPFEGVSLFFVLSGFLIGVILNRIIFSSQFKWADVINFWIRRWLRTIPAYLFVLLLLICLNFLQWQYNFYYFLFSQNLFSNHPVFFSVAWSLSIEEWFYLIFPGAIFVFSLIFKDKFNILISISILFLLIPLISRLFYYENSILEIRKIVIFRLDSIIYGVIASIIYYHKPKFWLKNRILSALISLVFLLLLLINNHFYKSNFENIYIFNLEALSVFFILPLFQSFKRFNADFLNKAICFSSKISYSLYLVHGSVVLWFFIRNIEFSDFILSFRFEIQRVILFSLYISLSICLAIALHLCVELPFLKIRERNTTT